MSYIAVVSSQPHVGLVHERAVGATVEWYTPPAVFERLGLTFDLDPASPGADIVPWVPAARHYTRADDGLTSPWFGRVWCNPPYGPEATPFIERMIEHGHGIMLIFARTDTRAVQRLMRAADALTFTAGRISFVRDDGYTAGAKGGAGSLFAAFGNDCVTALAKAKFGYTIAKRR